MDSKKKKATDTHVLSDGRRENNVKRETASKLEVAIDEVCDTMCATLKLWIHEILFKGEQDSLGKEKLGEYLDSKYSRLKTSLEKTLC